MALSNKAYSPMSYGLLMKMKYILQYFKILVTDRFYILRERDLYYMGLIMRKIMMKPDLSFGGVCVILVGNTSQIPPVLGFSLWDNFFFRMQMHKANHCGD